MEYVREVLLVLSLFTAALVEGTWERVGPAGIVREVVGRYLSECRLVVVGCGEIVLDSTFAQLVRAVGEAGPGVVVLEAERVASTALPQEAMQSDAKFPCRAFVLYLGAANTSWTEFLAKAALDVSPGIRVLGVGEAGKARQLLNHAALHNTAQALYLALPPSALHDEGKDEEAVTVISRCHYCDEGRASLLVLDHWHARTGFQKDANLFPDQFTNCQGHKFKVVSMEWFPFLTFTRDTQQPGTSVTPQDSVDSRMLDAIAKVLNFTYVMRMPEDSQWGLEQKDGQWTGTVGTLQRRKADFSMLLNWSSKRRKVIDFSRIYAAEPLVIVSTQPRPKPHYLALVAPFAVDVWLVLLGVCVFSGAAHWVLQRARHRLLQVTEVMEASGESYVSALLYTSGLLMQNPPFRLPRNLTGQVLVGWWLLFGLLTAATYRSSLIAHLSVPAMTSPVDTFEELTGRAGWSWGLEPTYGAEWEWFKGSASPTVRKVFKAIEVLSTEEHLRRVMEGRHALLTWKFYIQSLIASRFTDTTGYTSLYIGRSQHFVSTGYGWGFRKGAPFLRRIDEVKQWLLEAGLVNYWLADLIETAAQEARMERAAGRVTEQTKNIHKEEDGIVLGLEHLQTALYLLLLGSCCALLTLLVEVAKFR